MLRECSAPKWEANAKAHKKVFYEPIDGECVAKVFLVLIINEMKGELYVWFISLIESLSELMEFQSVADDIT